MSEEWPEKRAVTEELDETPVSKTSRKRQMTAVQKLGEELLSLKPAQLGEFDLDPTLLSALEEYHRLPNRHEAKRRQLQYIGKLMRKVDHETIASQLETLRNPDPQEIRRGQNIAHWIGRLERGEDGDVSDFMSVYPESERQQLRQLVRNSRNSDAAEPHRKRLLDFLRDNIT